MTPLSFHHDDMSVGTEFSETTLAENTLAETRTFELLALESWLTATSSDLAGPASDA